MPDEQAIQAEVDEIHAGLKDQPPHTPAQVHACKQIIKLFLYVFQYHMYDEVRKLVAKDYIQHNVNISTGGESIIQFAEMNRNPDGSTQMKLSYKRILVDGEYVMVHMQGDLQEKAHKVMDIFRFRDGLFVEHWDAEQAIPPQSEWMNPNGPF